MESPREIIVKNVKNMFPEGSFVTDFRQLVKRISPGAWNAIVPVSPGITTDNIVNIVVDRAILDGWIRPIVDALPRNPSTIQELAVIYSFLQNRPEPTTDDPSAEVLLDATRPFANRVELRTYLKSLCRADGPPVLVVTGEPQTGKSFSFYLAQHIARQQGFITSQFEVAAGASAEVLASDVMRRIGIPLRIEATGLESGQRAGKVFADQVKDWLEERQQKRIFVFDGFPLPNEQPLPPETTGFIVRLAKYADEELRPFLRLMLIRFPGTLPDAIEEVTERDQAQPFTDADMFDVLRRVATSRGWDVSDQVLRDKIREVSGKSLRDRFKMMRKMIRTLSTSAQVPSAPGDHS